MYSKYLQTTLNAFLKYQVTSWDWLDAFDLDNQNSKVFQVWLPCAGKVLIMNTEFKRVPVSFALR